MNQPKFQKASDKSWSDETGFNVEHKRLNRTEKLKESTTKQLHKGAMMIHNHLTKFKKDVIERCQKLYETAMEEQGGKAEHKGNFTFYNFDRSLRVAVKIQEQIDFDDLTIKACKDKLDEYLENNIETKNNMTKEMIMDAFETQRGKLDAKKVMGLLKYRSKEPNVNFQKALDLLEESIRHPSSKTYFQLAVKDDQGEYQNIELNFSSIKC